LQRGIFLLSIRMVAGRRSEVHGVKRKESFAVKCLKNLSELVRREKATGGEVLRGGSPEMTKLSWRR
jgi:hypothetical protein